MNLPKLNVISTVRQVIDTFRGYNHNLRVTDGEFYDMENLVSDYYPVLSPRGKRGVYVSDASPTGLIAKDSLCYTDGTDFVMDEYRVNMGLNDKPKQLVSMGAYVIILPDKKYINTKDLTDFGSIEAAYPGTDGQSVSVSYEMCKVDGTVYTGAVKSASAPADPTNKMLWIDTSSTPHVLKIYSELSAVWTQVATTYIKISAAGIAEHFQKYDAVVITGFPQDNAQLKELEGNTFPLWDVYHDEGTDSRAEGTNDYIVIVGILDEAVTYSTKLSVKRSMPEMDFIVESENRLWGCRYGVAANGQVVNEIYASKLGDFKNWSCFMGLSTDSYTASCGTDGQFTGAVTHLGYPLFFKENCVHKVYGNYPSNFQIQTTACQGVQKGCEKSLAIVNATLYYKGVSGVCAYDGSLPSEISYVFANEAHSEAVGGAHGSKYYISMKDSSGQYVLFVYDAAKGLWHKEDSMKAECFCSCRGEMYAICGKDIITLFGSGTQDSESVQWMAQTGEIGLNAISSKSRSYIADMKYISRVTIRMSMDVGATIKIYAKYDLSDEWVEVASITGTSLRSFSIPIRPRRCDHLALKMVGTGMAKIYSIAKTIEQGSDIS